MFTSSFVSQEQTSCFSDTVNTNFVPFQVSRITFSGNTDFFTVNDQMTVFHFNGTVETAVSGVIFQHVCQVINRAKVVNTYDVRTFLSSTENNATDTAKTVDTYFDSHIFHQLFVSE